MKVRVNLDMPPEYRSSLISSLAMGKFQILHYFEGKNLDWIRGIFELVREKSKYKSRLPNHFVVDIYESKPPSFLYRIDAGIGIPVELHSRRGRIYWRIIAKPGELLSMPSRAEDIKSAEELEKLVPLRNTYRHLCYMFARGPTNIALLGAKGLGKTLHCLKAARELVKGHERALPVIVHFREDVPTVLSFDKYATEKELGERARVLGRIADEPFLEHAEWFSRVVLLRYFPSFIILNDFHYFCEKVKDGKVDLEELCTALGRINRMMGTKVIVMDDAPLGYVYKFINMKGGKIFQELLEDFGIMTAERELELARKGDYYALDDANRKVIWIPPPAEEELILLCKAYGIRINFRIGEIKPNLLDLYINTPRRLANLINIARQINKPLTLEHLVEKLNSKEIAKTYYALEDVAHKLEFSMMRDKLQQKARLLIDQLGSAIGKALDF